MSEAPAVSDLSELTDLSGLTIENDAVPDTANSDARAVTVWVNPPIYEGIRLAATAIILPALSKATKIRYRVGDVLVIMPTKQHMEKNLAIWVGRRIVHLQSERLLVHEDLRLASLRPLRTPEKAEWQVTLKNLAGFAKRSREIHAVKLPPVVPAGSLNRVPGRRDDLGR
jgi:hypothetical protein